MQVSCVREYMQQLCQKNENIYGPSFFEEHLSVVANCADALAKKLSADVEVVELASYFHDISAVMDAKTVPDHAKLGAELARKFLLSHGYPKDRADKVADAIVTHSEPCKVGAVSAEAVCLSNADAMSRILRPGYWFYMAFAVRKYSFAEGRQWFRSLLKKEWEMLIDPAKELVLNQYSTAIDLLS